MNRSPHFNVFQTALALAISLITLSGSELRGDLERMPDPENFWAFQTIERPEIPKPKSDSWSRNDVDRFVFSRLKANNLQPSVEARKADYIRRATFDLLGLPPTPEEVEAFIQDTSEEAHEELINRLLDSPHYGEKWGQHWLDVIRYSESEGFEYDRHLPGAWRFRDYVIRSFNEDKPFDQFIREQLAGDEFEEPNEDAWIATGFHRFGPVRRNAGNPEIALSRNEVLTERTDIIGTALMGLTLGCARCHEHKLDPFTQEDYYSLQAFVAATHEKNRFIASQETIEAWQAETDRIKDKIKALEKDRPNLPVKDKEAVEKRIAELKASLPEALPTIISIENDPEKRTPIHVLKRGIWERKGDLVEMRPPEIFNQALPLALPQDETKPRTALAGWLTDPENPMTARVLVNRVWQYHFGNGIVNTPNDFGYYGGRPSHPELLDYLASELLENGWRLKPLHRMIMLSSAYRQSSQTPMSELAREIDPENRLLWKFNRRRLQAEEVRDAILAVSGTLNTEMFGESVITPVEEGMIQLLYDPDQWEITEDKQQHYRRSVYLIAKRNLRIPFMETFDQPTLQSSCGRRESSTHAPQALELLNGDLANELAEEFSRRLEMEARGNRPEQINRAWQLTLGREPSSRESDLAEQFLEEQPMREFSLAMFNLNEFLYVR